MKLAEYRFKKLDELMQEFVKHDKELKPNPEKFEDLIRRLAIAEELFVDMDIQCETNPLGLGDMSITIKGFDIVMRGENDIDKFCDLVRNAENFEIYSEEDEQITFSITYGDLFDVEIK